jgi:hypothetical protein
MSSEIRSRTGTHPEEGIKAPCVVATSANITLSGEQTINGAAIVADDRVLVKDQTDTTENGIYIASASAWSRAPDWNAGNDVSSGICIVDAFNDEVWKVEFTGDYTPGTTALSFDQIFTPGSLADGAVTTDKIADLAVTLAKLARQTSGYILVGKGAGADIEAVAVSGDMTITSAGVASIGASKVVAAKIAAEAVTLGKLARQNSGYILVGKGAGTDVAAVAVSGDITITDAGVVSIGNAKVTAVKLATNSVETSKIVDAAVTEAKLSTAVQSKLNASVGTINNFRGGLRVTNGTDTEHDLDISIGTWADSTNTTLLATTVVNTIEIDEAIGTGNGGFPSGLSLTADTTYHIFIVAKADGSDVRFGFDTSLSAANVRSDWGTVEGVSYTLYKRIWSVLTDGSSNIRNYNRYGNECHLDTAIATYEGDGVTDAQIGTSRTDLTTDVPTGIKLLAHLNVEKDFNAGRNIYVFAKTESDPTVGYATDGMDRRSSIGGGGADDREGTQYLKVITDTAAKVSMKADGASTSFFCRTLGWTDDFDE